MDNITALDSLIRDAKRISASVHIHPDGDALGCGLALVSYLKECRGKDAVLMVPDPGATFCSAWTAVLGADPER